MNNVETEHPIYTKFKRRWELIRDCVEGDDAIKKKGDVYLPKLCRASPREEEIVYKAYQSRAFWVNYTGQALENIHGMIMRRCPTIDAPDEFKKSGILDNIDGRGTNLHQFLSDSVYDTIQTCFGGLLADIPQARDGMTIAEAEDEGITPYMRYYKAEDIINWKEDDVMGGRLKVVVLREAYDDSDDMFVHKEQIRYRVLTLGEDGFYKQLLYTPIKDKRGRSSFTVEEIPFMALGQPITYIPFKPILYKEPEKPMLEDMAKINIGHFQKVADYENGVHKTTLPTGYITGHNAIDDDGNQEEIILGDDVFLTIIEPEAKVGTLAFAGDGLTHSENAIRHAEEQMAVIGTRIIAPEKNMAETAESGMVHMYGENGKMATFARNVGNTVSEVLTWIMNWSGYEGKVKIDLDVDYEAFRLDPNSINAIANLSREEKFPMLFAFQVLQKQGYIDINYTYEDYIYLLELESQKMSPMEVFNAFNQKRESESRMIKNG